MNPAAIIALCALGFTVFVQVGIFAYFIGRLGQRVQALESAGPGQSGLALQFAEFRGTVTAKLESQSLSIEGLRSDLAKDLSWVRDVAPYEVNRTRGAER